ncbi:MAG: long-chain fatty acid--CoA ligase [bacterium]|nr:long-chain fatty acid--CoA ligase [bacterium]
MTETKQHECKEIYKEVTFPGIFRNRAAQNTTKAFLKYKKDEQWIDLSWNEVKKKVDALAYFLVESGVEPGDKIAIYSENRPEWAISDLAVLSAGGADVTIYPTNSGPESAYIINDSDARFCFCSGKFQVDRLLEVRKEMKGLEKIIVFDDINYTEKDVYTFSDVLAQGEKAPHEEEIHKRIQAIDPAGLMTLMYTSGTTGNPKGVMLSHNNMVMEIKTFLEHQPHDDTEIGLSLLPLSHALERSVIYNLILYMGETIAYSRGPEFFIEDLLDIRPTVLLLVPRVLEKIYEGIIAKVALAPPVKKKLFYWSVKTGRKAVPYIITNKPIPLWIRWRYNLAYKLVLSKLRSAIGMDNVRCIGIGGAPLARHINEFFQAAQIQILTGYGLTETCPVTHTHTWKTLQPIKMDTVGTPLPGTECKIEDDGEILLKGPQIMMGYYKKPEETRKVLSEDGWFQTGDIGFVDRDGYLMITDRKKDIIITAGGKNIAPQVIENKFKENPFIDQLAVIGDKRKYLTAIIVPDGETLARWAESNGIDEPDPEKLNRHDLIKKKFQEIITGLNQELGRVEQIKRFHLAEKPFTQEDGELTPTLKIKRKVVREKYADIIEELYSE